MSAYYYGTYWTCPNCQQIVRSGESHYCSSFPVQQPGYLLCPFSADALEAIHVTLDKISKQLDTIIKLYVKNQQEDKDEQ